MTHEERKLRRDQITQQLEAGKTTRELVDLYGVSIGTIQACQTEKGRTIKFDFQHENWYHIIADLCRSDLTLESIGQKYDLTKQRVHQIYQKAKQVGIPVKNHNKDINS